MPATTANNPTFESIDRFLQYLSNQQKARSAILNDQQSNAYAEYVRKLQTSAPPRDFVFPGYEIVERLYQFEDRAEVVARRTDLRHRRLSRLRIFFPVAGKPEEQVLAHERATNTLNAVATIGDHPNILKVWGVPNENNFVVEGSDWSDTGTLRDVLDREGHLGVDRAIATAIGITRGLVAAHKEYIVHRSLSCDNILVINEIPKLMNFDLSFQLEDERVTVIPDTTKLKRVAYIAPEIYTGGVIPEATADLFSLGVILFEMITGQRPFACSSDLEQMNGVLGDAELKKLKKRGASQSLVDLVFDLVKLDRAQRPSDAGAILARLEGDRVVVPVAREPNPMLKPGSSCGVYVIEEYLRRGAESQIYRAVGIQGRKVALKLFNCDVELQRIVDEQRFAAAVHHPSIVRVDTYNQWDDGRYFIAFDWVSSRSLRNEIGDRISVDTDRLARFVMQLLDGLNCLHQRTENGQLSPLLHNDIKPENILIAEGDRPVLIDFGIASKPHVGTYQGTKGYVAPDFILGQDREYCESGDLYALAVTLKEWVAIGQSTNEAPASENAAAGILAWLAKGCNPAEDQRFLDVKDMREAFTVAIDKKAAGRVPEQMEILDNHARISAEPLPPEAEHFIVTSELEGDPNPFVPYLNSLHSRDAASENALAESQACNSFSSLIHVSHPLVKIISDILLGKTRSHVILTGHAGDGKSTIAIEIFKLLNGNEIEKPLTQPLKRREDLASKGVPISVVKDFSEWSSIERSEMLEEMLEPSSARFLLVSNTGTLLQTFNETERRFGGDWVQIESDILGAMNASPPKDFTFRDASFAIVNMAMVDNLRVAEQIFRRMLSAERWSLCASTTCQSFCPIYRNVTLIQQNLNTVSERLFLAYRRMYEYGTRLTLRQLCAHLAYMITSGLSHQEIVAMSQKANPPKMIEFMFFNRFFGENGLESDAPATQLRAVRSVRLQGFGSQPSPVWERRLWLRSQGRTFELNANSAPTEFETLRLRGAGLNEGGLLTSSQARDQVRRAVFFLHKFRPEDNGDFITSFLKSVMIIHFARWQSWGEENLGLQEDANLRRRVVHVLQEHFTGMRLPEGATTDGHLFITLSRRSNDVRQSAQVVLARYHEDDFELKLDKSKNGLGGVRRELKFTGKGVISDLFLPLALPFLDYVMMRNKGQVGKDLQSSFVDRLEQFKDQLMQRYAGKGGDDIMLVRLRTNHTFRRQIYAVRNGRLEVTDG